MILLVLLCFVMAAILKPWSLIMLHMKFKIHGCSGLRDWFKSFEWT